MGMLLSNIFRAEHHTGLEQFITNLGDFWMNVWKPIKSTNQAYKQLKNVWKHLQKLSELGHDVSMHLLLAQSLLLVIVDLSRTFRP